MLTNNKTNNIKWRSWSFSQRWWIEECERTEGSRVEWTLELETLVIIWLVLGMCRYTWAINQTESVLNKMTKVVRVNLMQGLFISIHWAASSVLYSCILLLSTWGPVRITSPPSGSKTNQPAWTYSLLRFFFYPNKLLQTPSEYITTQTQGIFSGATVATKCDYVCENNSASVVLPLHSGKWAMY